MTGRKDQGHDPGRFGFLALLRLLERRVPDKPRIGKAQRRHDRAVRLGQDPYLAFPATDLAAVDMAATPPEVRARFLGVFGPFGALPLNTTEEVMRWLDGDDRSFVDFADIFGQRFLELFFRAWSDAQPITQFDHPGDRYQQWLLSLTGLGTPPWQGRDDLPDTVKLRLTALAAGRVKSPVRLRQMIQLHFGPRLSVEVEEMVPTWLTFEADNLSRIGLGSATLGRDLRLGSRVRSLGERIRLHLTLDRLSDYRGLLPGQPDHDQLRAIVLGYLGQAFEVEVALWLPRREVPGTRLGGGAQLGWLACIAPGPEAPEDRLRVATFRLDAPPEGRSAAA